MRRKQYFPGSSKALGFLLLVCLTGCFWAREGNYYREGIQSFKKGDFLQAEGRFLEALNDSPESVEVLNNLALTYQRLDNYNSAEHYFQKALKIKPESFVALVNLGSLYLRMKKLERAEENFNKAKKVDPHNTYLSSSFGLLSFQLENFSAAQEGFSSAVKTREQSFSSRMNLVNTFINLEMFEEARKMLGEAEEAEEISPSLKLSQSLMKSLLDYQKANYLVSIGSMSRLLQGGLEERYDQLLLLFVRANAWRRLGFYQESNEDYRSIIKKIETNPGGDKGLEKLLLAEACFCQGLNFLDIGSYREAEELFNQAEVHYRKISARGRRIDLYSQLIQGIISELNGELSKARSQFLGVLDQEPANARALYHLGIIDFLEGKYELAQASLQRVVALKPYSSEAHNLLGAINFLKSQGCESYYREGYLIQAEREYRLSLEYGPQNHQAYENLYLVYRSRGDLDQALNVLLQLVKLRQERTDLYYELGFLLYQMGKENNALWAFSRVLELDPDFTEAQEARDLIKQRLIQSGKK